MKLFGIAAAAMFALSAVAPVGLTTPADAQRRVEVRERTVVKTRHGYGRPGYHRKRVTTRRVCTNRVRDGRRVRVCRTVRRQR